MNKKNEDALVSESSKELSHVEKSMSSIVMPAVSPAQALEAWNQYQELKKAIVDPKVDVQIIEGKEFLKKSYWRKIATFFNLSVEVVEEKREQIGKTFVWHFTCKAVAPNSRFAVGVGSCDAYEKATLKDGIYMGYNRTTRTWYEAKPNTIHNIRATAETRAMNRAISNLVGGGEVSAEEISTNGHAEEKIDMDEVDKGISEN